MSAAPKLNPISKAFLAQSPPDIDFSQIPLQTLRDNFDPSTFSDAIPRPKVVIDKLEIPCYSDGHLIPVDVYRPASAKADEILPVLVYFPGGGFSFGPQSGHSFLATKLAGETHCAVFFVNYSLSPEAKFPVSTEECFSVTKYVSSSENAKALRIDPTKVAIGGDSAGGSLSIGITLLVKERKLENEIKYQVLFYPCLDAYSSSKSFKLFQDFFYSASKSSPYLINNYVRDEKDKINKIAFGINAKSEDLVGLPPALIITTSADPLRDEGEDYAGRLLDANVPVSFFRVGGTLHGFMSFGSLHSSETLQIIDLTTGSLRRIFSQ